MDNSIDKSKPEVEIDMTDIQISDRIEKKQEDYKDYDNKSYLPGEEIRVAEQEKKKRDEKINYHLSINENEKNDVRSLGMANPDITENDLQEIEKFQVPSNLKKTFIFSTVLFIVGTILIVLGFIEDVAAADPGKGITFWVLGGIILIPGGYYSYQFYRAKKTLDMNERDEILDNIPEL